MQKQKQISKRGKERKTQRSQNKKTLYRCSIFLHLYFCCLSMILMHSCAKRCMKRNSNMRDEMIGIEPEEMSVKCINTFALCIDQIRFSMHKISYEVNTALQKRKN